MVVLAGGVAAMAQHRGGGDDHGDQLEKMAPRPPSRCELSSLMTAAMNPHEIPVAAPFGTTQGLLATKS
jgi:hypothetical protein